MACARSHSTDTPALTSKQEIPLSRITNTNKVISPVMNSNGPTNPAASDELDPEDEKQLAAATREANRLPELRLILLGWRWPGKSLTGNTILGREEFRLERAAEFCVKRETEVDGRKIMVVDTPGWFSAQTTPADYQQEMVRSVSMCAPGPHAFLLVIPVGMFTETDQTRIEENLALFGEDVWKHTLVVFTWAEILKNKSIERHIRREGRYLQWVVDKCKKRYHVINNYIFGEHPQLTQLMEKVEKIVTEEGGYFTLKTEESETKSQAQNQCPNENLSSNNMKENRDLGARPKKNSSCNSLRAMDVDPSQSLVEGVTD